MDKYEKRRQRLIQIRDEMCGGKAVDVARKIEREPSYVSRMLYEPGKNGKKRIADDMVEIIETAFKLPRGWMDSIHQPQPQNDELEFAGSIRDGYVPVIGEAIMGVDGSVDMIELCAGFLQIYSADKDAYGLRVKGDSMFPRIHSGEFVVIEPNTAVHSGDEVFVRTSEGKNMIKVMTKTRDGNYVLSSINNEHKPITIDADQVEKMHFVSAIVKHTRYVDHDDVPRVDGEGI
ncbi:S24 family peptidase [Pantoea allii]|uniref:S24 family peptidase n=1 Tax=Pantoea allii TaxID=574096 RepID=UPI0024B6E04F|nr:LexA family transcriptional regulator [Pantoea allii]MDJ0087677.1 S24 family peptidase [Pantoea allii]